MGNHDGATNGDRWALLAGIVGPVLFCCGAAWAMAAQPGHDVWRQFVSELAAGSAPGSLVFRILGFGGGGVSVVLFGRALHRRLGRGTVIVVFGATMVVAGIFPCDPGGPIVPRTVSGAIHNLVSFCIFPFVAVTPFFMTSALPRLRGYSLVVGVVAVVVLAFDALSIVTDGLWRGFWERVFIALVLQWLTVAAVTVLVDTPQRGGSRLSM